MPVKFELLRQLAYPSASNPDAVEKMYFQVNITDTEIKRTVPVEFWLFAPVLETFPADEKARADAIRSWLEEQVRDYHFDWVQSVAEAPPEPVEIPIAEARKVLLDGNKVREVKTHKEAGTEPKGKQREKEEAQRVPFDALGRKREDTAEPADTTTTVAAQPGTAASGTAVVNEANKNKNK